MSTRILLLLAAWSASCQLAQAFVPSHVRQSTFVVTEAGGFEWEDPTESFDQGVENPFKNEELMNSEDGMKIDIPTSVSDATKAGTSSKDTEQLFSGEKLISERFAEVSFDSLDCRRNVFWGLVSPSYFAYVLVPPSSKGASNTRAKEVRDFIE